MERNAQQQLNTQKPTPRSLIIAFWLSLIVPGLGQVYNGQIKKAGIFFGLMTLIPLIFGIFRLHLSFHGLLLHAILEIAFRVYVLVDAVIHAKRQKNYLLKTYNTLPIYLLVAGVALATQWVNEPARFSGIRTFKLPTPSGCPTIHVGDYLIGDLKAYQNAAPDYGDIVLYTAQDGQMYSFRVVALPQDTFALDSNIVSINNIPCKATLIKDTVFERQTVNLVEEVLPNGHKHLMYRLKVPDLVPFGTVKPVVVPPDSYYVLGDNRDNASDSRFQGFVHKDNIKGRILYSYWGASSKRINIDFRNH